MLRRQSRKPGSSARPLEQRIRGSAPPRRHPPKTANSWQGSSHCSTIAQVAARLGGQIATTLSESAMLAGQNGPSRPCEKFFTFWRASALFSRKPLSQGLTRYKSRLEPEPARHAPCPAAAALGNGDPIRRDQMLIAIRQASSVPTEALLRRVHPSLMEWPPPWARARMHAAPPKSMGLCWQDAHAAKRLHEGDPATERRRNP